MDYAEKIALVCMGMPKEDALVYRMIGILEENGISLDRFSVIDELPDSQREEMLDDIIGKYLVLLPPDPDESSVDLGELELRRGMRRLLSDGVYRSRMRETFKQEVTPRLQEIEGYSDPEILHWATMCEIKRRLGESFTGLRREVVSALVEMELSRISYDE